MNVEDKVVVGRLIQYYRQELGITCSELARKIGIAQPTLWNIEHGCASGSMEMLRKIATGLGKTLQDIMPEE